MLRSLSNKLLLAVLLAVALPFAGFALFLDHEITDRLALDFARATLRGIAVDLAAGVDREVDERVADLESWARDPLARWALREARAARDGSPAVDPRALAELTGGADSFAQVYEEVLAGFLARKSRYDLIALLDGDGVPVALAARGDEDADQRAAAALDAAEPARRAWFAEALGGRVGRIEHHSSDWLEALEAERDPVAPQHHVGLAVRVDADGAPGVLLALVNWSAFESLIEAPLVKDAFRGLVSGGVTPSPYAWIWASDGDTIIAHQERGLYGAKVSGPRVGLPGMVADVHAARSGLYRPYTFNGVAKNAAFAWTDPPESGGFGWVVGVGIDNSDVERATRGVSAILVRGTVVVLVVVVLWAVMIARRTVAPIRALERHTQRVAGGDLDARVEIDTGDEVAELARAFNRMTAELAVQSERLVRAEKDAAWREMARQIAHDLKNPLTPIQLSLDLYERARREGDPRSPEIAERSLDMIRRQVAHLREIATGFQEFTGGAKPRPSHFDLSELAREVVELHADWTRDRRVAVRVELAPAPVHADRAKLRRAVTNLFANAVEAMPDGGDLFVRCAPVGDVVRLELVDSGAGLDPSAQARLFEPYFTTKSGGTGLGLAIARRVVDEAGGTVSLVPRPDSEGPGCRAVIELARSERGAAEPSRG